MRVKLWLSYLRSGEAYLWGTRLGEALCTGEEGPGKDTQIRYLDIKFNKHHLIEIYLAFCSCVPAKNKTELL